MRTPPPILTLVLAFLLVLPAFGVGPPLLPDPAVRPLIEAIEQGIKKGQIVGAQLAIGDSTGVRFERCFGTRGPDRRDVVDAETRFCIGSCSKPFAAACLLCLVSDGKVSLDTPVDRWLPEFKSPKLDDGKKAARASTLRELLAHRGGIYSQKEGATSEQIALIRNFRLTLEESVRGIAAERLLFSPGSRFAYSGAGYCVAGRVGEVAAGATFDAVFRQRIADPLGLRRTGYFLTRGDANVAVGGLRQNGRTIPHPGTPHLLGAKHRLALIGGSLYSTARETARFAQMVLGRGRYAGKVVLPEKTWAEFLKPQYPDGNYGLGWLLRVKEKEVVAVEHAGALAASRSLLLIDRAANRFLVLHWSLVTPLRKKDNADGSMLQRIAHRTLFRDGN